MPRVLCSLRNASKLISGVLFEQSQDGIGMLSEEISAERAESFCAVPGFSLVAAEDPPAPAAPPMKPVVSASPPPLPPADPPAEPPTPPVEPPATEGEKKPEEPADEIAALRVEAAALGITVNNRWGAERLASEIKAAKA